MSNGLSAGASLIADQSRDMLHEGANTDRRGGFVTVADIDHRFLADPGLRSRARFISEGEGKGWNAIQRADHLGSLGKRVITEGDLIPEAERNKLLGKTTPQPGGEGTGEGPATAPEQPLQVGEAQPRQTDQQQQLQPRRRGRIRRRSLISLDPTSTGPTSILGGA